MPGKKADIVDRMTIGRAIANRRKVAGLTQDQACHELGLAKSMVTAYEHGRAMPSVSTFIEICRKYNCEPNDLIPFIRKSD